MTKFINLHILQSFAYANPNRDDTGSPKTAFYGGALRGRISSQSWKRAIRLATEAALDERTHRSSPSGLAPMIEERLAALLPQVPREKAFLAGWLTVASLSTGDAKLTTAKKALVEHLGGESQTRSDDDSDAALSWLSDSDLDSIAAALVEAGLDNGSDKDLQAAVTAAVKQLVERGFGPAEPTVAAFGRMFANANPLSVDASTQVSHAITVSEMTQEVDYFTAVDDCDPHGAGHLGLNQFTGGTFYRNLSIDTQSFLAPRNHTDTAALRVLIESMIEALPSGKKATTANNERPIIVVAEVGGRALSYEGAFEDPVPAEGGARAAVTALLDHIDRVSVMTLGAQPKRWISTSVDVDVATTPLRSLVDAVVTEVTS